MPRVILIAVILLFVASLGLAQSPDLAVDDPLAVALERLGRGEYTEALVDLDKGLDTYASGQRIEDVKRVYMRLFVNNRTYSNVLMNAMKKWVEKHRTDTAGLEPHVFTSFRSWVEERDALAAATINLAHNSPDWK
jgi:hypothetical protein